MGKTSQKTGKSNEKEGNVGTGLFELKLVDNQGIKMVDPAGFEPATKGLWDLRSNHWAKDPQGRPTCGKRASDTNGGNEVSNPIRDSIIYPSVSKNQAEEAGSRPIRERKRVKR